MLRARLTLLYATLLGGILLLFGGVVYGLVNVTLTRQVDDLLEKTANEIIKVTHVNSVGELSICICLPLELATMYISKVRDREPGIKSPSSL